jgi:antitoxin component of MazEF toxin-antitoxin module
MITKLQSWGNSQGVRLPKSLLGQLQLETGTSVEVELSPKGDAILLRPIRNGSSQIPVVFKKAVG